MKMNTLAVHAGQTHTTDSIAPDIVLSTTFRYDSISNTDGHRYTRASNPNRHALETALAKLEGGERAFAFASGMAAITALFQTLGAESHIIFPDDVYHGARDLIHDVFATWGLSWTSVDMTNPSDVAAAILPNTKLIWVETPSNPSLKIADIQAIASIARENNALCAVDNTWTTPIVQRPFNLGADVVMYSTTKYFGGHSDVLSGALIVREGLGDSIGVQLATIQKLTGSVPSPFDCWLLLRSMPTLPLRVRQQCHNAATMAAFLADHPRVAKVNYPGLASHPQHEIAVRQMHDGFGGMLSFDIDGDFEDAASIANRVQLIGQATSLGGVETLIEHRAGVEGPRSPTPPTLLRLSVGIEDVEDLIADLQQALANK